MIKIYGYDFIETGIIPKNTKMTINTIATETVENYSSVPSNASVAAQYFMTGLSYEMAKSLKDGMAYLVFEIVAINHKTPTANGRIYPKEIVAQALNEYSFQNRLRLGGIPGENEHPLLSMVSNDENVNKFNMFNRIEHIDAPLSSHSIIGWRQDEENTYFTIKTSIDNPIIARNLLNGILPAFSLRSRGEFERRGEHDYATKLKIITIDEVRNPSNSTSIPVKQEVHYVDPVTFKNTSIRLTRVNGLMPNNIATESFNELNDIFKEGDTLLLDPNAKGLDVVKSFAIESPDHEVSFESIMKKVRDFM